MRFRVSPRAAYAIRQKAVNIAEAVSVGGCASAGFAEAEAVATVLHLWTNFTAISRCGV